MSDQNDCTTQPPPEELPPRCPQCGYFLTADPAYKGRRCCDNWHQEAGMSAEEMEQWKAHNAAALALYYASGSKAALLAWADSEMARQLAADPADDDDELPF